MTSSEKKKGGGTKREEKKKSCLSSKVKKKKTRKTGVFIGRGTFIAPEQTQTKQQQQQQKENKAASLQPVIPLLKKAEHAQVRHSRSQRHSSGKSRLCFYFFLFFFAGRAFENYTLPLPQFRFAFFQQGKKKRSTCNLTQVSNDSLFVSWFRCWLLM